MGSKQWIVPVVAGMLSLSLVGCGTSARETTPRTSSSTGSDTSMIGSATTPPRSSADNYTARTSYSSGEKMVEGARYYADGEGAVDKDGRDMTQKGCENCHRENRALTDVERAMRDVGRTMESTRTDL